MALDDIDLASLDEVIHGRVRLGIMTLLAGDAGVDFSQLKAKLALTDGNLSVHLRKLEEAGYVAIDKRFVDRKSQTTARITGSGRAAFIAYLDAMDALVREARSARG